MFTKLLFVAIFGCTLVLASPDPTAHIRVTRGQPGEKVTEWWHNTEEKIKAFFGKIGHTFRTLWNRITGKDSLEKQKQLNELKKQYEALQDESAQAIQAKKAEWERILAENEKKLQEMKMKAELDVEREMEAWNVKFEELKENADVVIQSVK